MTWIAWICSSQLIVCFLFGGLISPRWSPFVSLGVRTTEFNLSAARDWNLLRMAKDALQIYIDGNVIVSTKSANKPSVWGYSASSRSWIGSALRNRWFWLILDNFELKLIESSNHNYFSPIQERLASNDINLSQIMSNQKFFRSTILHIIYT